MESKKNPNKKRNVLFFVAIVVLCVLVLLLIFFVKKDEIYSNLKETDFFGKVFGSTPEVIENHVSEGEKQKTVADENGDVVIKFKDDNQVVPITDNEVDENEKIIPESVLNEEIEEKSGDKKAEEVKKADSGEDEAKPVKKEKKKAEADVGTSQVELCFVIVNGDGSVIRKSVKRSVPKNDSPLTTAINLLLAGPDGSSGEAKCMTLIPEGSKLLGAKVLANGVAELNFNDAFEFNPYGVEGSIHQLEQIVYTATAFPTVNSVQFLIEGRKQEYLGSEGQWIGSPLSRSSF